MVTWKEKEASIRALESGGRVDPIALVEAARNPSHPCHSDFTWDVDEAAAKCWRDEARRLIRACKFEVLMDEVTVPVVSYVSSGDEEALFVSVPKLRGKNQVAEMLVAELAMLLGNVSRVKGLALAKSNIVGVGLATKLGSIQSQVEVMKSDLEE